MSVKAILDEKGRGVLTVDPSQPLAEAARMLGENRIGALVVTVAEGRIAGIISERDIVRVIGAKGAHALSLPVSAVMTSAVQTCRDSHSVNEVMEIMTNGRFRHLPVETDGRLDGIVSIGDVVKRRLHEVQREAEQIRHYIATA
jgi:CBS domain-containing protein